MRILILCLAFVLAIQSGCSLINRSNWAKDAVEHIPNTNPQIEELELDVRETIIRENINDFSDNEIIYITFGRRDDSWIKPPADFLRRFDDLCWEIKSIGEASIAPDGWRLKSSEKGSVLEVKIERWIGNDSVNVHVSRDPSAIVTGPSSPTYIYKIVDGKWKFDREDDK